MSETWAKNARFTVERLFHALTSLRPEAPDLTVSALLTVPSSEIAEVLTPLLPRSISVQPVSVPNSDAASLSLVLTSSLSSRRGTPTSFRLPPLSCTGSWAEYDTLRAHGYSVSDASLAASRGWGAGRILPSAPPTLAPSPLLTRLFALLPLSLGEVTLALRVAHLALLSDGDVSLLARRTSLHLSRSDAPGAFDADVVGAWIDLDGAHTPFSFSLPPLPLSPAEEETYRSFLAGGMPPLAAAEAAALV